VGECVGNMESGLISVTEIAYERSVRAAIESATNGNAVSKNGDSFFYLVPFPAVATRRPGYSPRIVCVSDVLNPNHDNPKRRERMFRGP
jgi:hypothetical protein